MGVLFASRGGGCERGDLAPGAGSDGDRGAARGSSPPTAAPNAGCSAASAGSGALPSYIEQMERTAIQKALEENRWNKTRTAAQLGITFRALRYKLKKLGME